jgi:hypothetical protein
MQPRSHLTVTLQTLSRALALSPWALSHDQQTELEDHARFINLKPFEIVAQVIALDVSRSAPSVGQPVNHTIQGSTSNNRLEPAAETRSMGEDTASSSQRSRVSVREMIATTIALKSGADLEIVDPPGHWLPEPTLLTADVTSPPSSVPLVETLAIPTAPSDAGEGLRAKALQAVAILQRESLLLRNELNYQLWLKRGLLQNVARLQQERVAAFKSDLEMQHLVRENLSLIWLV